MDPVAAYAESQAAVIEVAAVDPERPVPACPAWTVKDVVAHLAGLARCWVTGELDGYASDAWTQAQVDARARDDLAAIATAWQGDTLALTAILADPADQGLPDPLITAFGPAPAEAWPMLILTDLAHHEHDIRGAVDRPGARRSGAVQIGWRSQLGMLRLVQAMAGLPPLAITAPDLGRTWQIGREEAVATLSAPVFELFRASGGRRSRSQIEALDWDGDPADWPAHFVLPSYATPSDPVLE